MSAANEASPGLIESKEDTTSQGTGTNGGAGTGKGTGIGNGQGSGLGEEAAAAPAAACTGPAMASSRRVCCAAFVPTTPRKPCARKWARPVEGVVIADGSVGDVKVMR